MDNQISSNRMFYFSRFKRIILIVTCVILLSLLMLFQFRLGLATNQVVFFTDVEFSTLGPISDAAAGNEMIYTVESNDEVKQEDVRVAGLANGNLLVGWDIDVNSGSLLGRIFDSTGAPLTANIDLYDGGGNSNDLALTPTSDNGFYALWFQNHRIVARKFDGAGIAAGPSADIISDTVNMPAIIASEPDMVELTNGNLMLTWQRVITPGVESHIASRLFDNSLSPLSAIITLTDVTLMGSPLPKPAVAPLKDGGAIVTWSSDSGNFGSGDIYFQLLDATGAKVGSSQKVNPVAGAHTHQQIALLPNGNVVIVYDSDMIDGNGRGIAARIYDGAGNAVTDEFLVNTVSTSGWQTRPDVVGLKDNSFVVTWESFGGEEGPDGSGSSAVLAVQIDQNGNAVSDEFVVNQSVEGTQDYAFVSSINGNTPVVVWDGIELIDTNGDDDDPTNFLKESDAFMRILHRLPTTTTQIASSTSDQPASAHIKLTGDQPVVSMSVKISGNYEPGIDVLQAAVTSPVVSNYDSATGTLVLSGSTSFADYAAAIKAITFESSSANTDDPKMLTWAVYGPSGLLDTTETQVQIVMSQSNIYLPLVIR